MQILTKESEIKAAIAMLNPVARDAAQALASHILNNQDLLDNPDALNKAFVEHCLFAMGSHGWDLEDTDRIKRFSEEHGSAVMNLAISIVAFAINQAERKRRWGWLGKAAALTAGAIIGSLFG